MNHSLKIINTRASISYDSLGSVGKHLCIHIGMYKWYVYMVPWVVIEPWTLQVPSNTIWQCRPKTWQIKAWKWLVLLWVHPMIAWKMLQNTCIYIQKCNYDVGTWYNAWLLSLGYYRYLITRFDSLDPKHSKPQHEMINTMVSTSRDSLWGVANFFVYMKEYN